MTRTTECNKNEQEWFKDFLAALYKDHRVFNVHSAAGDPYKADLMLAKQALGFFNIRYDLRFDSSFKQLYKASRSFCETDTYFIPKMDLFPSGQTANVAFYADPDNQDAIATFTKPGMYMVMADVIVAGVGMRMDHAMLMVKGQTN